VQEVGRKPKFQDGEHHTPRSRTMSEGEIFQFCGIGFSIGKKAECNEDAFFTCSNGIGVSDGVGGWKSKYGFDSSFFSR
jgi:hypothetical protein